MNTRELWRWVAGLALGLLWGWCAAATAPDRILYNGKIITVNEKFAIASAIAVRGERIVAVGTNAAVRRLAGPNTQQIDLAGRTVVPGLIDNHLHYLRGTNFMPYETRLEGVLTRTEALAKIAARAKELGPGSGPGKWIYVIGGWHEQQFRDKPGGFSQAELDAAAPNNPVYIQKTYSDFYMNSAAIKIVGPAIGDLYKGSAHVRTSNYDGRKVMYAALKYMPRATVDPSAQGRVAADFGVEEWISSDLPTRLREVKAFNAHLNSIGLTTVYDLGYLDGTYEPVEKLHAQNELTVRVFWPIQFYIRSPQEVPATIGQILREKPRSHNAWYGLLGMGEHVYGPLHDSAFQPRQVFPQDYYNQFYQLARAAARRGWQIHEHTAVESTVRGLLSIGEEIAKEFPIRDLRWTLAHVDLVSRETIERAKKLGWVVAVHNQLVKPVTPGVDRPSIRMIQDSGIRWGMGSDGTVVATINPFHTIWSYTAGKIFPEIPAFKETITREQALIAHTRSNAWLLFMEKDLGTLEKGKFADLVVLDRDYLTIPVDEIRDIRPVMTMVGGRIVYERRP